MTYEAFRIYAKSRTGDPPRPEPVDARERRLSIRPLSDNAVIGSLARGYDPQPTHSMRGPYDAAYRAGRILKCLTDETYWMIVSVEQIGRRRRGVGHSDQVRLRVARHNWGETL